MTFGTLASDLSSEEINESQFITPVTNKVPTTSTANIDAATTAFNHVGHLPRSLDFDVTRFLCTTSVVVSSYSSLSISGVLSLISIFKAFNIAFSTFSDMFPANFDGNSSVSLEHLSIESSGVTPVIILYKVAPQPYTSVHGPCSPRLLYCSGGAYPGLTITDRLLL